MFDPFFGIAALGAPFALAFLYLEARRNACTAPSVASCIVALFAAYGVYVWLLVAGSALLAESYDEQDFRVLQGASGVLACLIVGIPFTVSARKRRRKASTQR